MSLIVLQFNFSACTGSLDETATNTRNAKTEFQELMADFELDYANYLEKVSEKDQLLCQKALTLVNQENDFRSMNPCDLDITQPECHVVSLQDVGPISISGCQVFASATIIVCPNSIQITDISYSFDDCPYDWLGPAYTSYAANPFGPTLSSNVYEQFRSRITSQIVSSIEVLAFNQWMVYFPSSTIAVGTIQTVYHQTCYDTCNGAVESCGTKCCFRTRPFYGDSASGPELAGAAITSTPSLCFADGSSNCPLQRCEWYTDCTYVDLVP